MRKYLLSFLSFLCITFTSIGIGSCSSKIWDTIYVDGYGLYYNGGNTYTIVELPEEVLSLREWTIPEKIGRYKISGLGEEWHETYLITGNVYWDALSDLGNIRKLNVPKSIKKIRAENLESVAVFETEGLVSSIEINGKQHEGNVWFLSPQEDAGYQYLTQENIINNQVYITEGDTATFLFSLGEGNVRMEDDYNDLPVTKIGSFAFSHGNYTNITLGKNVNEIEENAFTNSSLETVDFSDKFTTIGAYSFAGVSAKSINLPEGILTIEEGAFRGAVIEAITLPQTLTSIGVSAFENARFGGIELPNNILAIHDFAFRFSNLVSVKLPKTLQELGEGVFTRTILENIDLSEYMLSEIPNDTFLGAPLTGNIVLSNNVKRIGHNAFQNAKFTSFPFPESLEVIGAGAFYGCQLEKVELPSSVHTFEVFQEGVLGQTGAFGDNNNLTEFAVPDACKKFYMTTLSDCNALKKLHLGKVESLLYIRNLPNLEEFTVHEENKSFFVKEGLLYKNERVFTFTDGYPTFENVSKLIKCPTKLNIKSLVVDDVTLGEDVFYGNEFLEEITLNIRNKAIPCCTFKNCTSLKKVVLSNNIESISEDAFYGCENLTEINLENVSVFNESSFEKCKSLQSVDFSSASLIGVRAFHSCGLQEVYGPNIVSVEQSGFEYNNNLKKVTLNKCESLGHLSFANCEKLVELSVPLIKDIDFHAVLHTPLEEEIRNSNTSD